MPTESFEPILNRDKAKVIGKPIIDIAAPVLKEMVDWATNLYPRCQTSKAGERPEAFSLLALFLHVIQSIDAVEVLVSQSCGTPANLILRSAFEAKLSIEYICESKSTRRSAAWAVKHILQDIDYYKNYNPDNPKGVQFRKAWDEGNWGQFMSPSPRDEASKAIENLEQKLKQYTDVYRDYQRMIRSPHRLPEWYSIDNGPKNLWDLSRHLKQGVEYEMFYAAWSKQSHATDIHHLTLPMPDGPNILGPLRSPLDLVNVSTGGLMIMINTIQLMIKKFRPNEMPNFVNWHQKEILNKQIQLAELSLSALKWYGEMFKGDKRK